ncbi:MAG: SRPBCC family protein [Bacteroidales bacterium]|nr:MAG: SRPBCC family protein [Bacteroidales bacterium]
MGFYQLQKKQIIPSSIDIVWDFISTPQNLKLITPPGMGFDIKSENLPNNIYAGMIIEYTVRPLLGIPTTWVTEISQVVERKFFIDEQRVGPYKFWHHQHLIEPHSNGVLMIDIVSYKPPLGFIGSIANGIVISRKLEDIFEYRRVALEKLFGKVVV